jgi:hypothetical protein
MSDFAPKRPNEEVIDARDRNLLKSILVNCKLVLPDTHTDQKFLQRKSSGVSIQNNLNNFSHLLKRNEQSVITYRPNVSDPTQDASVNPKGQKELTV